MRFFPTDIEDLMPKCDSSSVGPAGWSGQGTPLSHTDFPAMRRTNQPTMKDLSRLQAVILFYLQGKCLRPAQLRRLIGGRTKDRIHWSDGIGSLIYRGMVGRDRRGYFLVAEPPLDR